MNESKWIKVTNPYSIGIPFHYLEVFFLFKVQQSLRIVLLCVFGNLLNFYSIYYIRT